MTFQRFNYERKIPMEVKHIDKAIGFGLVIIIGYYVVGMFMPALIWGEIGLVVFRIYLTQRNQRK